MKATIERATLLRCLSHVQSVVERRNTIPILSNVLIDADLGGGVVKKRVALPGKGKSGGSRTIVAHRKKSHWFFVYGFEKNDRANITDREKVALQKLAADLFAYSKADLDALVAAKNVLEICNDC